MLHVSIVPAAPAPTPPPLKPDEYLKLRRRAAGLSIVQVARLIAPEKDQADAVALVAMLEAPGCRARHIETLEALRRAFPFDLAVYRQLADEPAERHSAICRSCGCSEWDPCEHHEHGSCGWADSTTCTHCAEFGA